jgi:ATP/maltotriose-dependent transcriptional regulator MalT
VYYPTPQSRAAARESLAILAEVGDVRAAAMSKLAIAWEAQYGRDFAGARRLAAEAATVLGQDESPSMRAQLHYVTASLDLGEGAFDRSIGEWRRAITEYKAAGDSILGSAAHAHLGIALRQTGRTEEALAELRRAVELVPDGESTHGLAFALVHLAHTLLDAGSDDRVRQLLDRADEVARHGQNPRCQAWAAWGRARLAASAGEHVLALEECRRATALLQDRDFPWAVAQLWDCVARTADAAGEPGTAQDARARAREVLVTSS